MQSLLVKFLPHWESKVDRLIRKRAKTKKKIAAINKLANRTNHPNIKRWDDLKKKLERQGVELDKALSIEIANTRQKIKEQEEKLSAQDKKPPGDKEMPKNVPSQTKLNLKMDSLIDQQSDRRSSINEPHKKEQARIEKVKNMNHTDDFWG
jgi:hypothetical protein